MQVLAFHPGVKDCCRLFPSEAFEVKVGERGTFEMLCRLTFPIGSSFNLELFEQSTELTARNTTPSVAGISFLTIPMSASTMFSPAVLGRRALRTSRQPLQNLTSSRRGLAAASSGAYNFETGEAFGVKFASRDLPGPTTTLAVVAKAGTRYQSLPGFSDALEKFAFKVGSSSYSDHSL